MESLKRFIAAGLLMSGLSAFAANPAYESFKGTNGQVVTTPGIGAARIVLMSGQNFQPGSTNLTNWANLSTNVIAGETNWSVSAGTLFPTSAGAIETTNLSAWTKLIAKGAFIAETRSRALVAGTNTLAVLTNSYLLLDSPTNDAASVVVQIGPAASSGQILFVVNNQTNRAFTIYDGSASGSGIVELQGNFVSTNLGGLILMNQGNWVEVGRFSPGGLTTSGTMNPTIGYFPYNQDGVNFGDGPIRRTDTNQIMLEGGGEPGFTIRGLTATGIVQTVGTDIVIRNTNSAGIGGVALITAGFKWTFLGGGLEPATSNLYNLGSAFFPFASLRLGRNNGGLYFGTNVYSDDGTTLTRDGVPFSAGSGPSFADLVWTNTGTAIQPTGIGVNTNHFRILPFGQLRIGPSALADSSATKIVMLNDDSLGDPTTLEALSLNAQSDPGGTTYGGFELDLLSGGGGNLSFYGLDGGGVEVVIDISAVPSNPVFTISVDSSVVLGLQPSAIDGTTPYTFDTSVAHTSGNLNEWKNLGVTHLTLASTNGLSTPAITAYGAGSHPWQFGMATNMVNVQLEATNVVEITVNGVAYLIPAKLK